MPSSTALTVVVAVKEATPNLELVLASLQPEAFPAVEFLFVVAGSTGFGLQHSRPGYKVIYTEPDCLVPHLWRDGILRAHGKAVALTTAQCIPEPTWVKATLSADLSAYVGVGGVISIDFLCGPAHRAMYLLRYLAVAPPQVPKEVADIAADNSVYRRDEILEHPDLLANGFWEPSFHRRFAKSGMRLKLDPAIQVTYRGNTPPWSFVRQRLAHGREYGHSRAARSSWPLSLSLMLASPSIPLVLLSRVIYRATRRAEYRALLPGALPWLAVFSVAWGLGEAAGYIWGVRTKAVSAERTS